MRMKGLFLFIVVSFLPIFFTIYSARATDTLRTASVTLTKPALDSAHFVTSNVLDGVVKIKDIFKLYRENRLLRRELFFLRSEMVRLGELREENERLRALLEIARATAGEMIVAQVIGRDLSHWSEWVILDKGKNDGVWKDAPVVSYEGLIGRTIAAGPHSARVMLLTDPSSKVAALAQSSRDAGLLEGAHSGLLKLRLLDVHAEVQIGETIVSSGLGGIYPKGLPIGTVTLVGTEADNLSLFAMVKPFADFDRLEEVLCLVPSTPN